MLNRAEWLADLRVGSSVNLVTPCGIHSAVVEPVLRRAPPGLRRRYGLRPCAQPGGRVAADCSAAATGGTGGDLTGCW